MESSDAGGRWEQERTLDFAKGKAGWPTKTDCRYNKWRVGAALSLRKRATDTNDDGAPLISENQLILLLARGKLSSRVQEQARALMAKPLDKQRAWSEEQEAAPTKERLRAAMSA